MASHQNRDDGFGLEIKLSASYHLHSIERLLRDLGPLMQLEEPTVVRLDLTNLHFIGPAALALLVAALRCGREQGLVADGSVITTPAKARVRTYLYRMDALRVLFEKEPVDIEDPVVRHDAKGLKECEHFESQAGGRAVAKALTVALQEEVETDKIAATSLDLCLIELTENVYFHADTPHGGFAAAQTFRGSHEIEVAIVDLGIGIAASLAKNPAYADAAADDITAITTAMEPTVTASPDRNAGYGLAFTRFLLEMNDGRLIVWSGEGHVQIGERSVEKRTKVAMPGTLVALRLHTDRPFDFERAYQQLKAAIENIEGEETYDDDDVRTLADAPS